MVEELVFNYCNNVDLIGRDCKKAIWIQKVSFYVFVIITFLAIMNCKTIGDFFSVVIFFGIIFKLIYNCCRNNIFNKIEKAILPRINWDEQKELKVLKGKKKRAKLIKEYDEIQKKWIKNYCHRKKINMFEKTVLIKQEVEKLYYNKEYKIVKPVIIFTLLMSAWEKLVDVLFVHENVWVNILSIFLMAYMIYIIGSEVEKEYRESKKIFNHIDKYMGKERLFDLLLYNAIIQKK